MTDQALLRRRKEEGLTYRSYTNKETKWYGEDEGSLRTLIVPLESWEIRPRKASD